ncbi:unnamed protein product [Nezara viridula]|uniref:Uncharacterized protein n=1 Tax=Nezara viridula TaxID=85310 RepID=A0A9P0H038_NEZVI|nr:unnamed protein product [Nezara viridula]
MARFSTQVMSVRWGLSSLRIAGKTSRNRVRNERIQGDEGVPALREAVKKSQFGWLIIDSEWMRTVIQRCFLKPGLSDVVLEEDFDYYGWTTSPGLVKRSGSIWIQRRHWLGIGRHGIPGSGHLHAERHKGG